MQPRVVGDATSAPLLAPQTCSVPGIPSLPGARHLTALLKWITFNFDMAFQTQAGSSVIKPHNKKTEYILDIHEMHNGLAIAAQYCSIQKSYLSV